MRVRRHVSWPSPATVIALVALFVALGGTALALTKNTVGSKQLKPGAVKAPDLAKNAVTSQKVKNGSLQSGDFAPGQLPAGAQGPAGPTGPQGAAGSARAYAMVYGSCTGSVCTPQKSKNVSQVTRPQTGVYCVRVSGVSQYDIAPIVSLALASNAFLNSPYVEYQPISPPSGSGGQTPYCSERTDFTIATRVSGNLSNDVGFSFLVP